MTPELVAENELVAFELVEEGGPPPLSCPGGPPPPSLEPVTFRSGAGAAGLSGASSQSPNSSPQPALFPPRITDLSPLPPPPLPPPPHLLPPPPPHLPLCASYCSLAIAMWKSSGAEKYRCYTSEGPVQTARACTSARVSRFVSRRTDGWTDGRRDGGTRADAVGCCLRSQG